MSTSFTFKFEIEPEQSEEVQKVEEKKAKAEASPFETFTPLTKEERVFPFTLNYNETELWRPIDDEEKIKDPKKKSIGASFMRTEPIEKIEEEWRTRKHDDAQDYKKKHKSTLKKQRKNAVVTKDTT